LSDIFRQVVIQLGRTRKTFGRRQEIGGLVFQERASWSDQLSAMLEEPAPPIAGRSVHLNLIVIEA
jgi:hypothetical protein